MFWLKEQLAENTDRKFIIISHTYGGARQKETAMWNTYPNAVYFEILEHYKDRIIIEFGGSDHLASLRYHTNRDIADTTPALDDDTLYHNMVVVPSISPWFYNNPATSVVEIDEHLIPRNMKSTYMNLRPTIGRHHMTAFHDLEFRDLDYAEDFGISELTPAGMDAFRKKLQTNGELQQDFMIAKLGFDPSSETERKTAFGILEDQGLVKKLKDNPLTYSAWAQICVMAKNLTTGQYAACLAKDPKFVGLEHHEAAHLLQ